MNYENTTQVKILRNVHYLLKKRALDKKKFVQDELNDILKKELGLTEEGVKINEN